MRYALISDIHANLYQYVNFNTFGTIVTSVHSNQYPHIDTCPTYSNHLSLQPSSKLWL
jgi:hypothetical protein